MKAQTILQDSTKKFERDSIVFQGSFTLKRERPRRFVSSRNLSCESQKGDSRSGAEMTALYTFCPYAVHVLLRKRRASRTRLREHDRADKQAAARLQSLLREECFSGQGTFLTVALTKIVS